MRINCECNFHVEKILQNLGLKNTHEKLKLKRNKHMLKKKNNIFSALAFQKNFDKVLSNSFELYFFILDRVQNKCC